MKLITALLNRLNRSNYNAMERITTDHINSLASAGGRYDRLVIKQSFERKMIDYENKAAYKEFCYTFYTHFNQHTN